MIRTALASIVALALAVGGVIVASTEGASAQYPTPAGNLIVSVSSGSAGPGEDVTVTATAVDANGDAVANASCTFSIVDQPGSDATVDPGPYTTDSEGHVSTTLQTGSVDGNIVVQATCTRPECSGSRTSQQTACELSALGTVSVGSQSAAEPPASLPDTGAPDGDGGAAWAAWALLAAGAGVILTGTGAAALLKRRAPRR